MIVYFSPMIVFFGSMIVYFHSRSYTFSWDRILSAMIVYFSKIVYFTWSYTLLFMIVFFTTQSPSTVDHQTISIIYTWKYNLVPPIGYLFKIRTRSLWWIVRDFDLAKSIMLLLWLFRYNFEKFFGVLFLRKFGWF